MKWQSEHEGGKVKGREKRKGEKKGGGKFHSRSPTRDLTIYLATASGQVESHVRYIANFNFDDLIVAALAQFFYQLSVDTEHQQFAPLSCRVFGGEGLSHADEVDIVNVANRAVGVKKLGWFYKSPPLRACVNCASKWALLVCDLY